MANNIWKLADVLQAQAVADLIDIVSVEEIKENVDKVLPTALVQIVNKATDKTFVRILNVASLDTQAILWGDSKIQERARALGFKEPVVKSDKQLSDFVDVPDDHKRKPAKKSPEAKALGKLEEDLFKGVPLVDLDSLSEEDIAKMDAEAKATGEFDDDPEAQAMEEELNPTPCPKDKFLCPTCGPVDTVLFDGGQVREREFEGVNFEATKDKKGKVTVHVPEDDYFDDFNMKKLTKEMAEIIEEDNTNVTCKTCNEPLDDYDPSQSGTLPVSVPIATFDDVMADVAKAPNVPMTFYLEHETKHKRWEMVTSFTEKDLELLFDDDTYTEFVEDLEMDGVLDASGQEGVEFGYSSYEHKEKNFPVLMNKFKDEFIRRGFVVGKIISKKIK